ncbi:MAG TPA: amino acid permease [Chitinophagaceae bacterium]|nr:amino acid permease [Chitinophagaceae bacterium]
MISIPEKENLKREIGVRSLAFAIINLTVGTGIFILPAIIAENLGAAAIIAYLVCGAAIFLIALCFAEVGSKISTSGGTYTYIETAFGPFAGFLANNLFWIGSCMISDAAVANALADTLQYFFPLLGNALVRMGFFFLVFGGLAFINITSVKNGIRMVAFATFAKITPLLILIIAGAGFVHAKNLQWTTFPTISNIGATSLILFFAFTGIESAVTNSGEFKDPKRTVPLGIFFGILTVLILYICIQFVSQGVLGNTILQHKDAPLAAVAGVIFGSAGIILIIAVTGVSMLGGLAGEILAIPRVLFAGARDGIMPKMFGRVHPKFLSPHIAIIFYAFLGFVFALSGGFKQLATISVAATLLIYLGVVLATIKLRKNDGQAHGKTFRIRGGIIVPVLATCVIAGLLYNLSKAEFISIVIFITVFSFIYLSMLILKKRK